jgi:hypothetical protein
MAQKRTAPADAGSDDRENINGREPASPALVQIWCKKAGGPPLRDESAETLVHDINNALIFSSWWRDEYTGPRVENPSTQRLRRIADALAVLQSDLPGMLAEFQQGNPSGDFSKSELLLEAVNQHQPIVQAHASQGKGRPKSLERNLSTNISKKVRALWGDEVDVKAADAFASIAVNWLTGRPAPASDAAVGRARRHRT